MTTQPRQNGKNLARDRARTTVGVLQEILQERAAQDRTWGEQNHPLHSPLDPDGIHHLGRPYAHLETEAKRRFEAGERSGALILLEEVFEALAAKDLVSARTELVQVAAVAVMIVEGIDRARATGRTAADRKGNVRPCDTVASSLVTGDGTRQRPVGPGDDDHPRVWGAGLGVPVVADADDFRQDGDRFLDPEISGCPHPLTHNAGCGCPSEIPTCGADGCTPEYCPGGAFCAVSPPRGQSEWTSGPGRADLVTTHPYNGAGRLHGICRCGEGYDAPVHAVEGSE